MKIILGYQYIPTVEAMSVRIRSTTADPVPTCSLSVRDDTSSIAVKEMQEVWVIDEQQSPNPTWNLLQGPSLNSTDTSKWTTASSAGFSGSISFAGAPPVTINVTDDTHLNGFVENDQITQVGLVVPGVQYCLSGYLTIATPLVRSHFYLYVSWLDAGQNSLGTFGCGNQTTTPGGAQTRISGTGVAPAGAVYAAIKFGMQVDNATTPNGGTALLATLQFEPMWFSNEISYPTPDCNPAQTTCVVLPNATTIRQYRKFAGWVNHFIAQDYHGNARTWHIDAVGYASIFSNTYTISAFVNQYDSAIIASLLATYYQGNASFSGLNLFTTTNVVQGSLIANLQPNWDDLRTIFNNLAAQAGFYWTVDPYFNMYYQPPGYTQMPIALICDSSATPDLVTTFPAYNVKAETDFTQPGVSVLVLGGNVTTTLMVALTNGVAVTSLTVSAMPDFVGSGTVMSVSGNQGITLSSDANAGDTTLHINSFTPLASYSVGASISSNPYVGSVFDPAKSATYNQAFYGFGVPNNFFIRKINDSSLQSVSGTINRGIAELIQYDGARSIYHATTNVELLIGQGVQVTDAQNGFAATTLLIQQVVASWIGMDETLKDVWEYQVDLGNVNRAASSILSHIFRQTNTNTSAPAVNQTALVVLERFTYTDVGQYPYPLTLLADAPNAYYRLGEASGSSAFDYSGNGFAGTYNGSGVTYGVTGAITNDPNAAVTLDGSAGYVTTASGATPIGWSQITLEAWINLASLPNNAMSILSSSNTGNTNTGVNFTINALGAGIQLQVGDGAGRLTINANTYTFTTSTWYHVVGVYNSGSTSTVYVNGVAVKTGSHTGTVATSGHVMAIGYNPATSASYFPGTIDEAANYQTALSAARVLVHYNVGVTGHT